MLERLNPEGEVAHEEDIGEYAVLRRLAARTAAGDAPILDYKMIDDDFMLPVVAAHYLLEMPEAGPRGGVPGAPHRRRRNLRRRARAQSRLRRRGDSAVRSDPDWRRLIALKAGEHAGNWRDSEDGLGGGRYPYDVNGVSGARRAGRDRRLHESGLIGAFLDQGTAEDCRGRDAMAQVWRREAPHLFDVKVTAEAAPPIEAETYAAASASIPRRRLRRWAGRFVPRRGARRQWPRRADSELRRSIRTHVPGCAPDGGTSASPTLLTRPFPAGL